MASACLSKPAAIPTGLSNECPKSCRAQESASSFLGPFYSFLCVQPVPVQLVCPSWLAIRLRRECECECECESSAETELTSILSRSWSVPRSTGPSPLAMTLTASKCAASGLSAVKRASAGRSTHLQCSSAKAQLAVTSHKRGRDGSIAPVDASPRVVSVVHECRRAREDCGRDECRAQATARRRLLAAASSSSSGTGTRRRRGRDEPTRNERSDQTQTAREAHHSGRGAGWGRES